MFNEQPSPEPAIKALIPMYNRLQVSNCQKCGRVIAEPGELIRIMRDLKISTVSIKLAAAAGAFIISF
jgi:hypothetical protein